MFHAAGISLFEGLFERRVTQKRITERNFEPEFTSLLSIVADVQLVEFSSFETGFSRMVRLFDFRRRVNVQNFARSFNSHESINFRNFWNFQLRELSTIRLCESRNIRLLDSSIISKFSNIEPFKDTKFSNPLRMLTLLRPVDHFPTTELCPLTFLKLKKYLKFIANTKQQTLSCQCA